MTSLLSLPPLFLLPRWSSAQLLGFSARHYNTGPKSSTSSSSSLKGTGVTHAREKHYGGLSTTRGHEEHAQRRGKDRGTWPNPRSRHFSYGAQSYDRSRHGEFNQERTKTSNALRRGRQSLQIGKVFPRQVTLRLRKQLENGSKPSLLEELFPEQPTSPPKPLPTEPNPERSIPILEPPTLDEIYNEHGELKPSLAESESHNETKHVRINPTTDPCILVMQSASPHLSEADFRRIAPKGSHIEEWRGQEDPLKVIPVRDLRTLKFLDHYYLVFPNVCLARAYKARAERLHVLSQTHTPTAIHSALLPAVGTMAGDEDIGVLIREYTLVPPSQALNLRVLRPPYTVSASNMISVGGLPRLVKPVVRKGRSVLARVEGFKAETWHIIKMLEDDGKDRGMQWYPSTVRGAVEEIVQSSESSGSMAEQSDEDFDDDRGGKEEAERMLGESLKQKDRNARKWLITFEDEKEARRFIRAWHIRPFPVWKFDMAWEQGEPLPLVYTEFVW